MSIWILPSVPTCASCGTPMMHIMETFPDGARSTIRAWCVKEFCRQMGKQIVIQAVEQETK